MDQIRENSVKLMVNGMVQCMPDTVIQKSVMYSLIQRRHQSLKNLYYPLLNKANMKVDGKKSKDDETNLFLLSRLWKNVTFYLKSKQLDKATASKSLLEQRQREGAKERAEKSIKWQTKV